MNLQTHVRTDPPRAGRPATGVAAVHPERGLLIVVDCSRADGLAGPASQMAAEMIRAHIERHSDLLERFTRNPSDEVRDRIVGVLQDAFARAGIEVLALSRRRNSPLPVSADAVLVVGNEAFVAHIGSGRVYLARRGLLHRLTVDHTAQTERPPDAPPDPGEGAAVDAQENPPPSRALGMDGAIHPETLCMDLQPGDRLLVTNRVPHFRMTDVELRDIVGDQGPELLTKAICGSARQFGAEGMLLVGAIELEGTQDHARDARDRLAVLARMPIFAYCSQQELVAVAGATFPREATAGAILVRQGVPGRDMFLLVSGEVEVIRDGASIATLGAGSVFGEMAMLDEPRASATVRTTTDTELFVISRDAFFALLRTDATFAVKILWNLLLRISANLRTTSARLAEATGKDP